MRLFNLFNPITEGDLQALLDGELDAPTTQRVMDAIHADDALAARYEALKAEREATADALAALTPPHAPDRRRAVLTLQRKLNTRTTDPMIDRLKTSRKLQRIAAGIAAVLLFTFALAFQPIRAFASDVLGMFRVESFAVVDIDPERIEEISNALDENMYWGEAEFTEGEGFEPREVASLAEAADAAGFDPATPADAPTPARVGVSGGFEARFTPELETLQTVFETLGLDPTLLPEEMDGQPFDITVEPGAAAVYEIGDDNVALAQVPSPIVETPDGVDVQELGVAMLQLLGMSEREANRLAAEIDFTSTLVLPIPTSALGSVAEVEVNGSSGLLFEADEWERYENGTPAEAGPAADADFHPQQGSMLVWQADGYIFMVASETADGIELLAIAEGVR